MQTKYELEDLGLAVWVPKELDHHHADILRSEVEMLIHIYHAKNVVFDFAETDFMDSSGIGVLIGRARKLGFGNGVVYARNLNGRVRKIFHASGLEKIIYVIAEAR
ncbi:MAG: anti-sigma factor antagonist [Roseburia sp.]|nr:anti-sigma factor antagonist [Roseburia sp.]